MNEKCCICQKSGVVWRCDVCKEGKYCSKRCQKIHYPYHVKYCAAISYLENISVNKMMQNFSVREEQVDAGTKTKLL